MRGCDIEGLPDRLPEDGAGEERAYAVMQTAVRQKSAQLGAPHVLAHMDPAPADIAARLVGLSAQYNQNLLHPDLSPFATRAEQQVVDWLAPFFGMAAGHMCAGATIANLTALWCAREYGARRVLASSEAHLSVCKCAAILGLRFERIPVDAEGRLDRAQTPALDDAVLVLTAGTTGRGAIDDLSLCQERRSAVWAHVDAAWAGPMRLTRHAHKLRGIEHADSVSVSAHKWLFQPKDSALVFFADAKKQDAISFGGPYLAAPNVGVQGSRSAAGVALLGTLLAWGREGVDQRIGQCLAVADMLAQRLTDDPRTELKQLPQSGIVIWRPSGVRGAEKAPVTRQAIDALGATASQIVIDGELWVRQVAANRQADFEIIWSRIDDALSQSGA